MCEANSGCFFFDLSGLIQRHLRSYLDRPGVRPGGRLTFLLCDKKVSKETHPPRRPFGVPSLRTLSAGGLANSLRSDMQGRTTPPSTLCARRLTREGHTEPGISGDTRLYMLLGVNHVGKPILGLFEFVFV